MRNGREDELLLKLQQCVGKMPSKTSEATPKETLKFGKNRNCSFDMGNLKNGAEPSSAIKCEKKTEYGRSPRFSYHEKEDKKQNNYEIQNWDPTPEYRTNKNDSQQSNMNKYDKHFSAKKVSQFRSSYDYRKRQVLGDLAPVQHKNQYLKGRQNIKPSYQRRFYDKNLNRGIVEKQNDLQEHQQQGQEQIVYQKAIQQRPKRFHKHDNIESYQNTNRSKGLSTFKNAEVEKKYYVHENYSGKDRALFLEKNIKPEFSETQEKYAFENSKKNYGTIARTSTNKISQKSSNGLNRTYDEDISGRRGVKPSTNEEMKSVILQRSRKVDNYTRDVNIKDELEELALSKNDTFTKLQKIGQINQKINERIKKIIQTFENPRSN